MDAWSFRPGRLRRGCAYEQWSKSRRERDVGKSICRKTNIMILNWNHGLKVNRRLDSQVFRI